MNKIVLIGLMGIITFSAQAREQKEVKNKHFSLGVTVQSTAIAYEEDDYDYYCGNYGCSSESTTETDTAFGIGLNAGIAINNAIAFRGKYAFQEHDDNSDIEIDTLELGALFGTGLARKGIKAYGTVGYYQDKIKYGPYSESFSGVYAGGGMGYNFGPVSLEGYLHLREASDYEKIYGEDSSPIGVTGGMAVFFHF